MNEDSGLQQAKIESPEGLTGSGDSMGIPRAAESGSAGSENTNARLTRLLSGEAAHGHTAGNPV